ncbi:hypothetical protein EDD37DRAFT_318372 [Exophiala viscosa]|uniref:Rhamnolipids biosynthesis 3-oxoacyl-[acyl-carrier-protein] reductase n=1 Tax=Exophiala viscosa TaxID=2486360 RepID=A0AAN6DU58_9EURO|nr:hypothetical protein EDD36DRAFT_495994 [Exophiala viscosa]KAI1625806.1 hypothetical protein EDD37DRAFT_318372 [Exophiala viscosa]
MSALDNFDKFFRLDGKVALVTGGSRGLGLHAATAFLRAGAKTVFITARKAEGDQGINQAVDKLNAIPGIKGKAVGLAANVAQEKDIERLSTEIKKIESGVHILVANAGATWGGPFETTPDWANQKVLDLNVRGIFNIVKIFLPLLENAGTPQDPARVIVVSSTAGINVPHVGEHGTIMYSASKAAAHHLARNLAVELGPKNITTNTIAPGFFPSKLASGLIDLLGGEQELKDANPRRRLGVPEDIAGAMLYLAGPAAAYVNGVSIEVDGGAHLSAGRMTKL